jgi:hypothetical protein
MTVDVLSLEPHASHGSITFGVDGQFNEEDDC